MTNLLFGFLSGALLFGFLIAWGYESKMDRDEKQRRRKEDDDRARK